MRSHPADVLLRSSGATTFAHLVREGILEKHLSALFSHSGEESSDIRRAVVLGFVRQCSNIYRNLKLVS